MTADLLRQAADKLDEVAEAVEQEVPWHRPADLTGFDREDRVFIATMSPTVAKALAAWLLAEAADGEWRRHGYMGDALAVARAVLGEAS